MRCDAVGRVLSGESLLEEEGEAQEALRAHAGTCAACRERIDRFLEEELLLEREIGSAVAGRILEEAAGRRSRLRPRRIPFWALAAAAAAVALAAGIWTFRPGRAVRQEFSLPPGRLLFAEERIATGPSETSSVSLPDGSRFRVAPGSMSRFAATEAGIRCRVELSRGSLEAEIVKGGGSVVVVSEAGEIRVVGTAFTARAFRLRLPEGEVLPVLAVEVAEGAVDLVNAKGRAERVVAGRRGITRPEGITVQETAALSWREALGRWGKGAERTLSPPSAAVMTLLAGTWRGIGRWEDVLGISDASPAERRAAAVLAALTAQPEDLPALRALLATEADSEVRTTLERAAGRLEEGE